MKSASPKPITQPRVKAARSAKPKRPRAQSKAVKRRQPQNKTAPLESLPTRYKDARDLIGSALERVSDGFISFDTELNYTYVNARGGGLLGREPADLIGKNYWQEYPEAKDTPFANACLRALTEQTPLEIETYYRPLDRWFENRIYPSQEGLSIFSHDITARKKAELSLRESERRLREMLENVPLLAVLLDLEGRVTFCNEFLLQITGYSRDEVLGCDWFAQFVPDVRADVKETFLLGLQRGETAAHYENPIRTKSGAERLIRFSNTLLRDTQGQVSGTTSLGEDITERKETERALQENDRFISAIANTVPALIYVWDMATQGKVYSSTGIEQVLGFSPNEIQAMGAELFARLIHPDDLSSVVDFQSKIMSAADGEILEIEYRMQARDGGWHTLHSYERPFVRNDDGSLKQKLGVAIDITERKRAEDELQNRFAGLNAIYESAQHLQKLFTPEVLSTEIIHTLENILGYEYGAVLLVDEHTHQLVPFAISTQGHDSEFAQKDKELILSNQPQLNKGITGWVAKHGQTMRIGDVRQDPRYYSLRENIYSELCVPMWSGDKVIGVINTESQTPNAYSANDQRVLETVAAQIAIAIQNARLLDETRQSRDRLAELSRRLVEAHETEQRLIGRELHDQIGQMLTALKLTLAIIPQLPPEAAQKKLAQTQELVDDLLRRVSSLALELRPPMLDDLGLIPALVWHVNRYQEQSGISVTFKHSGVEGLRFEPPVETAVYRTAQEALTNVARHAQATHVRLEVHARSRQIEIKIEDNGRGFDLHAAYTKSSSGLSGMRERAGLLGGTCAIESELGRGTKLLIALPL